LSGEDLFNGILVPAAETPSAPVPNWKMDWTDGPEIVVEEQPAIAVYSNRAGRIVVRQRADWNEEEDSVVILSTPEVAAKVIAAIKREIGGAK
jgi:hypothetical protein